MVLTKRRFLAGVAAMAAAAAPARAENYCSDAAPSPSRAAAVADPLGRISARVPWGVAIDAPALYDSALIAALEREAPTFLAIANDLKFGNLYPQQVPLHGEGLAPAAWTDCDTVVALAARLRIPIRGDCLAWNDWLPAWLTGLAAQNPRDGRDLQRAYFEAHFKAVFEHFARAQRDTGTMPLRWCGVINEPFNPWTVADGVAGWRAGAWLDAFGVGGDGVPAYIHKAFELGARFRSAADTTLFLNEAHCDNDKFGPLVRPAMLKLVDDLQKAGRHVDAVGLECHLVPQWMRDPKSPDWGPLQSFIRELSRRQVKIFITELDVNDCALRDQAVRDEVVARYMGSLVEACLETSLVTMVTNWDLSDRYSWLREDGYPTAVYPSLGEWAGCVARPPCPRPDLYDQEMRPKAARDALARALRQVAR